MDYKMRLKLRLESLMKKQKITNELLAKETGISMSSINRIRMGRGNPTVDTLLSICEFFNISLQNLTNYNDEELANEHESLKDNSNTEHSISLIKWENIGDDTVSYKEQNDCLQLNNNITSDMFAVFTPREYGFIPKNSLVIIDTTRALTTGDLIITRNIQTAGVSIVEYIQDLDKDYVCSLISSLENSEKKYFPLSGFEVIGVVLEFRNKLKEY